MRNTNFPLSMLSTGDVMTEHVLTLPQDLSLGEAAHLLHTADVSGAPVVDAKGRCVGVLSATDYLRMADANKEPDACRVRTPVCVCSDWQMVESEGCCRDAVRLQMHTDPVLVLPNLPVVETARRMLKARAHRAIVVDESRRPVGVVSAADVLAAIAFTDTCCEDFQEEIHCTV